MAEKLTTLAKRLRPFIAGMVGNIASSGGLMTEGPDIDLVGQTIGRGGDTILVFDDGGLPVAEYAFTQAGLVAALAAAAVGNVVQLPAGIITTTAALTVPAGVTLRGIAAGKTWNAYRSTIQSSGDVGAALVVAVAANVAVENLKIYYGSASSTDQRTALNQGALATATVSRDCYCYCANADTGLAVGHSLTGASAYAWNCEADADNNGGGNGAGYLPTSGAVLYDCSGNSSIGSERTGARIGAAYLYNCRMDGGTYGINMYTGAVARVFGGYASGGTADVIIATSRTLWVYGLQYDTATVNGTLTYLQGDRAAYSVENWHASDIEATALTRHLPLPGTANNVAVDNGTNWASQAMGTVLNQAVVYEDEVITLDGEIIWLT